MPKTLEPSSIAARLGLCAAALAGTAATATNANATVITSTTPISIPNTVDGVYINFLTGGTGTSSFSGWDFNPYAGGSLLFYWGGTGSSSGGVASTTTGPYIDLGAGSVISSASIFSLSANGANNETAAFLSSGTHILGFKFLNEATSTINYGYLSITTTGTTGFPAVINGWSYENSGGAITVSAVPEPETALMFSLGALALGAAHMRRLRRERKQQLS
ncbi:PEP-CTERM sorting domain-containing protein [Roseateles sp.]|uniref:PEP-CTERM sorting domain-containing protein n=1 Tax=Roseateles sp. TaxID=1971397 RepID=UPI003BA9CF35